MVDNGLKENDHEIQMGLMMIMKMIMKMMMMMMMMMMVMMMMMMIRLMVDFGPFFVDSATQKCGLKDHGVHFETWR